MLVVVGSYSLLPEARVVCSYLQAYGLDAVVFDENILSYFPEAYFAIGGFRVAVPEREAREARQLLTDLQPLEEQPSEPPEARPNEPVSANPLLTALGFVLGAWFSVPFLRKRWRGPA